MGSNWSRQGDPSLRSRGKRKFSSEHSSFRIKSFSVVGQEEKDHKNIQRKSAKPYKSAFKSECACSLSECSLILVALPDGFSENSGQNMNYISFGDVGIAFDMVKKANDIAVDGSKRYRDARTIRLNVDDQNFIGYRLKCACSLSESWLVVVRISACMNVKGGNKMDTKNSVSSRDVCVAFNCVKRAEEVVMEGDERRKALRKKWLDVEHPNLTMFRACMEMLCYAWYWSGISRVEAQQQLAGKKNGTFLVRDSEMDGEQFTLSFRMCNKTLHYRIQYHDDFWHFEARACKSVVEIVENITNQTFYVQRTNDLMPPFPVVLVYPLSRYTNFTPLQNLCRQVIQRNSSKENIQKLPIPEQLKTFLNVKCCK